MLTVIVLLIVAGILWKEFSKVRDEKKGQDAIKSDLTIIELNACKLREDLWNAGGMNYETQSRLYEIENLAKGLQKTLPGMEMAAKKK